MFFTFDIALVLIWTVYTGSPLFVRIRVRIRIQIFRYNLTLLLIVAMIYKLVVAGTNAILYGIIKYLTIIASIIS